MVKYIKSKKFHNSKHDRGLVILNISIITFIAGFVILCLFQVNSLVGANYQIRELTKKISELESINKNLEIEIAQGQSPGNLKEIVQSLGMVEIDHVRYLGKDRAIAARE